MEVDLGGGGGVAGEEGFVLGEKGGVGVVGGLGKLLGGLGRVSWFSWFSWVSLGRRVELGGNGISTYHALTGKRLDYCHLSIVLKGWLGGGEMRWVGVW